jgi:2'-5' RNA ligase
MTTILTLQLEPTAQAHFDDLRQQHFPPARNQIPAHLTLFHQLPDSDETLTILHHAAHQPPFPLQVTGLRSLGRGVAYTLTSPPLLDLHRRLSDSFAPHLIPQDRQRFLPHIVVQNKAAPEQARTLLAHLQQDFAPHTIEARGLDLWHYLGGAWKHLRTFPFRSEQTANNFHTVA